MPSRKPALVPIPYEGDYTQTRGKDTKIFDIFAANLSFFYNMCAYFSSNVQNPFLSYQFYLLNAVFCPSLFHRIRIIIIFAAGT